MQVEEEGSTSPAHSKGSDLAPKEVSSDLSGSEFENEENEGASPSSGRSGHNRRPSHFKTGKSRNLVFLPKQKYEVPQPDANVRAGLALEQPADDTAARGVVLSNLSR
jgi:hypothetical protein